jgi:hypothetical protein
MLERFFQAARESSLISGLTFPHNYMLPASFLECVRNFGVTFFIPGELLVPEFQIALWCVGKRATLMPVPEAPVNIDCGAIFRQNDIGSTGYVFAIQSKPIPEIVQQGSYKAFGARVFRPYS